MQPDAPNPGWFGDRTTLNRRFVIYLPSRTRSGRAVAGFGELRDGIAAMLSRRFGGATAYPATGFFDGDQETIFVIECFCDESSWRGASGYLLALMKAIGAYCDQEAVACSLDGEMMLIRPSPGDEAAAGADRLLIHQLLAAD